MGTAEISHYAGQIWPCTPHLYYIILTSVHVDRATLNLEFCLITKFLTIHVKVRLHPEDNGRPLKGMDLRLSVAWVLFWKHHNDHSTGVGWREVGVQRKKARQGSACTTQ